MKKLALMAGIFFVLGVVALVGDLLWGLPLPPDDLVLGQQPEAPSAPPPGEAVGPMRESMRSLAPPIEASAARSSPAAAKPPASDGSLGWSQFLVNERIIRSGVLSLVVPDVTAAIEQITALVQSISGAYVSATNLRQEKGGLVASVTVKVPSAGFEETLQRLKGIGKEVKDMQVSSQDVTEEYVDLQSQLRHLRATEERYLALLAKAERIEDILRVQERLSALQQQIERTQGRINYLERRTDFSTIVVNLAPVAAKKGDGGWSPLATAQKALANLLAAAHVFLDAAIYALVYALPFVPVAFLGYWLWRRRYPEPSLRG